MLHDTGHTVGTETGVNSKATDENGKTVVVSASHEAIKDYGWDAIYEVAGRKYEAGVIEENSHPPRVRVTTSDLS